jgi:GNAT superfamily N-acetyltransferase
MTTGYEMNSIGQSTERRGPSPDDGEHAAVAQHDMRARAYNLWLSLRSDPRFAYEGRLVALDGTSPETIDDLLFLVREQGVGVSWYVRPDDETVLTEKLRSMGYVTDRWDQYFGAADAVQTSEDLCAETALPEGYEAGEVGADTPDATIAEFAGVGAEQGVMVPVDHVVRGQTRPAVAMYVTGPDGKIGAIAGSVLAHHRDSPLATSAWWGMLCTHPAHRGKGLSKILGAMTIQAMAARHGATSFYTGVRHDNPVSQTVCTRLGVRRTEYAVLMALSPELAGGGPLTR